jgi:hypothetical protein
VTRTIYRFRFEPKVPMDAVEASILLSVFAAEGLHGPARVRMDGSFLLAEKRRVCVVDATTQVGRTISKVFTGLLLREFGEDLVQVERIVDETLPRCAATRSPGARR